MKDNVILKKLRLRFVLTCAVTAGILLIVLFSVLWIINLRNQINEIKIGLDAVCGKYVGNVLFEFLNAVVLHYFEVTLAVGSAALVEVYVINAECLVIGHICLDIFRRGLVMDDVVAEVTA